MGMVAGVDDTGLDLVRLLADPVRLKEKLAQLQTAKDEAQAVVDLVGPASEVVSIREKIEADRQLTEDLLVDAKAQAEKIVQDARAEASRIIADAKEEAVSRLAQADAEVSRANVMKHEAQTMNAQMMGAQAEVEARLKEVGEREKQITAAQDQLDRKQAELDQRIGQLEEVRARVSASLGG
jgi:cell division septum initiation protein DivIVA